MKTLKRFGPLVVLFALCLTAFAGETNAPPCTNPGETNSPPCTAPGETSNPPGEGLMASNSINPGDTHGPPLADAIFVMGNFGLDLTMFW